MFDKLEELEKKYNELTKLISDPEVIADQNSWRKYMKEQSAMKDVVDKYIEYKAVKNNMDEAKEMMSDPEMKDMAEEEYYSSKEKLPALEEELKILLLPKDENDDSNVIIEIRGGAGGLVDHQWKERPTADLIYLSAGEHQGQELGAVGGGVGVGGCEGLLG